MKFEPIARNYCVVTGNCDLEPLITFKDFPVFLGCVDSPWEQDLRLDMNFCISRSSGIVQLNSLVPLDILYGQSHVASDSPSWMEFHGAFADFIHQRRPRSVVEIGGAHGILSFLYQQSDAIPWTIFEPNPVPVPGCKARYIREFFGKESLPPPADMIVCSNTLEHIYDPNAFLALLADKLPDGVMLALSVPDLDVMIEQKYNGCMNFEHNYMLTKDYLEFMLSRNGFRIIEQRPLKKMNLRLVLSVKESVNQNVELQKNLYDEHKKLFTDYIEYYRNYIKELNERMNEADSDIYLFGAHIYSQFLIALGLDASKIKCVLDNDKKKHGKRLYGTDLMTFSPECLSGVTKAAVILSAAAYNDEIKSGILNNINKNILFF
ncbi:hypothetical protein FACS1894205_1830 [Alphaproteobacteria bacterium]|nr:hypothetical protein FACS1894205_1830 [Alphaproteobacteria bacterium]